MRHRVYGKHLGRGKDERDNLFKGLVTSLFSHGTIETSETKAKAIKGLVDRIINLAKQKKEGRLQSFLTDKDLRERLIKEIVPKLVARTSGYASMVKMGRRLGDQTMMVRMSLIGAEELKPLESRVKSQESRKKSIQTIKTEKETARPKPSKKATKTSTIKRGGKKS